ncbi:hypothetical protein [Roseibacillus persicicus]|uniref:Uncharacterized protein n=1 Tax=Roseibacillus persicicus TaxID=454148 RepID=A0A918TVR0_9BACT|nr:hypothetical protein [Roseibacillus persicicus]GHC64012.1 hypothetical protein GCM10007100_34520 [Roseibacillus persicicus]
MIQLDPEEIFGSAIGEAVRRGLTLFLCLYLGSALALAGSLAFGTLVSVFTSGFTSFPSYDFGASLFILPFWSFASIFGFLTLANGIVAATYYFRTEETTRKRFVQFTTIQQVSLAGAFAEYALSYSPSFLEVLGIVGGGLVFQGFAWGLFYFALSFIKNKQRISHEEHLMAVAAENAVWRQKVESMEHIPAPPSGPEAPKPRPLRPES